MKDLEALHAKEKPSAYQRRLQVVADFVHVAAAPLFVLDQTLLTLSKEYLTKEEETEALTALAMSFAVMANFISFVIAGTCLSALLVSTAELFWQGVYTKTPALKALGGMIGVISVLGLFTVWVGVKAFQAKTGGKRVRRTTLFVSLSFFAAPVRKRFAPFTANCRIIDHFSAFEPGLVAPFLYAACKNGWVRAKTA